MAASDRLIIIEDDDGETIVFSEAQLQALSSCSSSKQSSSTRKRKRKPEYSFCGICMDTKTESEMFENSNVCGHLYCSDCIRQHVAAKIKENLTTVKCPDPNCKGVIGPESCRSIVPKEVLERWESILCESVVMEAQKFYCPFKDCSAMLVNDGGVPVTQSECPNCHRLFCAQCKVAWHCGKSCSQFQSLKKGGKNQDDSLLSDLAKKKKWMKCPKCKLFVEKVVGCDHISCRCGRHFCYVCGKSYDKGGRQVGSRGCKSCGM